MRSYDQRADLLLPQRRLYMTETDVGISQCRGAPAASENLGKHTLNVPSMESSPATTRSQIPRRLLLTALHARRLTYIFETSTCATLQLNRSAFDSLKLSYRLS
jgi:hypothetical protein